MKARRPDHPPSLGINGDEGTPGRHGLPKEHLEALFFTPVLDRMLLPDERIPSDRIQLIKIVGAKRPQLDKLALQNGLKIE
jgi:hypothetical protein